MHTVTQTPDTGPDPQAATPYFRRPAAERAERADQAVRDIAVWYAGGLDLPAA